MTRVGSLSGLPPGTTREVVHSGRTYVLCNADGAVTALDGVCPHRGGPLGFGHLVDGRVVCPWHLWEFDCHTGEYDYNRSCKLGTYAVEVEGDDIFADLPESHA